MRKETLTKAIALLAASFPGVEFNAEHLDMLLNDLDDGFFISAVMDFVKNIPQIYPGTNIAAILRQAAEDKKSKYMAGKIIKLTQENDCEKMERWKREAVPMPEECKEELEKFGIQGAV